MQEQCAVHLNILQLEENAGNLNALLTIRRKFSWKIYISITCVKRPKRNRVVSRVDEKLTVYYKTDLHIIKGRWDSSVLVTKDGDGLTKLCWPIRSVMIQQWWFVRWLPARVFQPQGVNTHYRIWSIYWTVYIFDTKLADASLASRFLATIRQNASDDTSHFVRKQFWSNVTVHVPRHEPLQNKLHQT
jgi:hypothetical protein